jgi:hypothetical protein
VLGRRRPRLRCSPPESSSGSLLLPAAYLLIVVAGDLGPALEMAFAPTPLCWSRTLDWPPRSPRPRSRSHSVGWLTVRTDLGAAPGRRC